MLNNAFLNTFILLGALLWKCPSFAVCEFKMKKIHYIPALQQQYQIKISIKEACAANEQYKRELSQVELTLYKNNKAIFSQTFDQGLWQPKSKKFFLKNNRKIASGCLKGSKSITINLKNYALNSLSGKYLNLFNGHQYGFSCPQIKKARP
jgi:hypothetical protein